MTTRIIRPKRLPRAIVSVAFQRQDFELVAAAAEKAGVTLSQFIREAAMPKPYSPTITFMGCGLGMAFFSPDVAFHPHTSAAPYKWTLQGAQTP